MPWATCPAGGPSTHRRVAGAFFCSCSRHPHAEQQNPGERTGTPCTSLAALVGYWRPKPGWRPVPLCARCGRGSTTFRLTWRPCPAECGPWRGGLVRRGRARTGSAQQVWAWTPRRAIQQNAPATVHCCLYTCLWAAPGWSSRRRCSVDCLSQPSAFLDEVIPTRDGSCVRIRQNARVASGRGAQW